MKLSQAKKTFGRTLRKIRESRGLSQEQLAIESGYERTYISMVESGSRSPSFKAMMDLSEALQVRPEDLFKDL